MTEFVTNKPSAGLNKPDDPIKDRPAAKSGIRTLSRKLFGSARVSDQQVADLFDHLATLLTSGIPLIKALELARTSTSNAALRDAVDRIVQKVRAGLVFSEALAGERGIFNAVVRGMIKAAESSGRMDEVLRDLAKAFERKAEMKSRVMQALAYPAIISAFGVLTLAILICFVIPKLRTVFELWDTPLPLVTRGLLAFSSFMAAGGWLLALGLAAVFAVYIRLAFRSGESNSFSNFVNRLPLFSKLFFLVNFTRMTRTWGMLMRSGVPILEALRSSREVLNHPALTEALARIQEASARGERLQEAIVKEKTFPPLARDFLAIGEETGTLDQSFDKVSDYYERELTKLLKTMTTILEPVLILVIGVIVGFLVISLLLPIFQMSLVVQ